MTRRAALALAALALSLGLSGCVSLFPKSNPAQLYTFGKTWAGSPAAPTAPTGERVGVLLAAVDFPRAAQGDTLLTFTGAEAAYVADSRWVAPAVVLFREALERRFDDTAQRTRLIGRGDIGRTGLILRMEVRAFEAVYPAPEAIPTAHVTIRARLTRPDTAAINERTFTAQVPAADNRVGAIVAALDQGTQQTIDEVIAWTDATAAGVPAGPRAAPAAASRSTTSSSTTSTTTTTVQSAR